MENEIKKYRLRLVKQFIVGFLILIISILFHLLGSKKPTPQALWFFAGVFGSTLLVFTLVQWIKLKKYLNQK